MVEEDIDGVPSKNISVSIIVNNVIFCESFAVESDDVVQSNIVDKSALMSKWELVDYGDDSDE